MKNFKLTILGAVVLVAALALNLRHALNDYGIRDNKLHVEVLAQSNGSGGGSTDGGGPGGGSTHELNPWYLIPSQGLTKDEREERVACQGQQTLNINGSICIVIGGNWIPLNGGASFTFPSGVTKITCPFGYENCTTTRC